MGIRAGWLAFAVALLAVAPAGAQTLTPPPPTQAQVQAAQAACTAQGLTPATDAFRQCVGKQLAKALGGGPAPPSGNAPPPGAQAAAAACTAKGLTAGSDAFNACAKAYDAAAAAAAAAAQHPSSSPKPTSTGPAISASDQAAIDGCKASGVAPRTDAFKACVAAASAAASIAGWNGEQLAAVNVCKAEGNAFPSAGFAACLSRVLTKLLPNKSAGSAVKDVAAAQAECLKKKLIGPTALIDCVKAAIGG